MVDRLLPREEDKLKMKKRLGLLPSGDSLRGPIREEGNK